MFKVCNPFSEIPVAVLLLQICLLYGVELRETVEALLPQRITAFCWALGLSGFLCFKPEDLGGQKNVKLERQQDKLRDGLIAAQDPNKNICTSNGSTFVLRVVLLVFLAWIMLLLFSSSLIIVSLPLRRVLLSSHF